MDWVTVVVGLTCITMEVITGFATISVLKGSKKIPNNDKKYQSSYFAAFLEIKKAV